MITITKFSLETQRYGKNAFAVCDGKLQNITEYRNKRDYQYMMRSGSLQSIHRMKNGICNKYFFS